LSSNSVNIGRGFNVNSWKFPNRRRFLESEEEIPFDNNREATNSERQSQSNANQLDKKRSGDLSPFRLRSLSMTTIKTKYTDMNQLR
jgi:hypothetical protein